MLRVIDAAIAASGRVPDLVAAGHVHDYQHWERDINGVTVRIGGILLFDNGLPRDDPAPQAAEILKRDTIDIAVSLGSGDAGATIWGCDLSAEYVRINGEYRT